MRVICFFLFAAIRIAPAADDLRIRTIAGNGDPGGPAPGAMAEGSPLGSGWAIAFDSRDRLHVTTIRGELWRVDPDGKWARLWKSGGAGLLFGLAVDPSGRVFVADLLEHQVHRIDPDGTAVVVAGTGRKGADGDGGKATEASLDSPVGLAVDNGGNLFISESGRIRVVDSAGVINTYVSGTGGGALSIDRDGNLYMANLVKAAVQKIGPDRSVSDLVPGSPLAVAVCPEGSLYFTDFYRVHRLGAGGAEVIAGSLDRVFAVDDGLARDARFVTPLALACDSRGRVSVYDASAARVRQIAAAPAPAQ